MLPCVYVSMKAGLMRLIKQIMCMAVVLGSICACSTETIVYNPKEFDTVNYQKNVDNAVDAADILNDFGANTTSNLTLSAADLSDLVQADLYYNQGAYTRASPLYVALANKYKNPRMIYKAIVCLEHVGTTETQMQELNGLIKLFVEVAPQSKLAKLFQIKIALRNNDLSVAKDNLDLLIRGNETSARAIFLFMSSILGNDLSQASATTLTGFADYVVDEYAMYPEANLMAAIGYAAANNLSQLNQRLNYIYLHYPNWDVPLYWSADVLSQNNHRNELVQVVEPIIILQPEPSAALQNMYIAALIANNQLNKAYTYLQAALLTQKNRDNTLLNLGIIIAKSGNYKDATGYLQKYITMQVRVPNPTFNEILNMSLASFFDYSGNTESAVKYYQKISHANLASIRDIMLLDDYMELNDYAKVNQALIQMAKTAKLDAMDTLLFKSAYYISVKKYTLAYNLLRPNYKRYHKDKNYIYQYAVTLAMLSKTSQAIRLYTEYVKMEPDKAYGYNDLAYIYADQTTQYKLAKKYADIAYKLAPTDPTVLDTVGWVYFKLADYKLALAYIKTSYDSTHDADAAQHLIHVYNALGQLAQAQTVKVDKSKNAWHHELKKRLADKMLALLMYAQYGNWVTAAPIEH